MSEIVEDEFAEFSEPVESVYHPNPEVLSDKPDDIPPLVYSEPNMFLIVFIFTLTIIHFYSSQWINFVSLTVITSNPFFLCRHKHIFFRLCLNFPRQAQKKQI